MYKRIIWFFSFPSITLEYEWERERERERGGNRKRLRCTHTHTHTHTHTEGPTRSLYAFLLNGLILWLYNVLDSHANSRGQITSNLLLTRCKETRLLIVCNSRQFTPSTCCPLNTRDHDSFLPATHVIYQVFLPKRLRPIKFMNQVHFLFWFWMSDIVLASHTCNTYKSRGFSRQYPTIWPQVSLSNRNKYK